MQTSTLQVILNSQFSKSQDLSTAKDILNFKRIFRIADGIGANKSESIFHDQRRIPEQAAEDIDLSGVLLDVFGVAIQFTKIKTMIFSSLNSNDNDVWIGGAATNQFAPMFLSVTDRLVLKPGGIIVLHDPGADGYVVTPGAGDLLKIENGGGGVIVIYDIIIIGETS